MYKDWQYYLCLAAVAGLLAMAALLQSCRTMQPCVPEVVTRDSVRVVQRIDSVYLYERDSVFIYAKKDTVWVERWKTRYKDAVRVQRDTICDTRTEVQVQQVRYVPKYYRFCSWAWWIVVAVVMIRMAWWVARKYYGR